MTTRRHGGIDDDGSDETADDDPDYHTDYDGRYDDDIRGQTAMRLRGRRRWRRGRRGDDGYADADDGGDDHEPTR